MKGSLYIFGVLLSACAVFAAPGGGFSRYSLIIERRPFSPPADAVDDAAQKVVTVAKPPAFVKDLRMCAITESPAGTKVGFLNIRQKPQRPYYMYVGDSEDGIELVDADYDKSGALLRKGGEQYWMYMGGGSTGEAAGGSKKKTVHGPGSSRRIGPGSARTAMSSSSYAERRRKRLEELRRIAEEERKRSDEEIKKKLQEYQKERLRKGLIPLAVQLTPESDAELVKEGVLPPEDDAVQSEGDAIPVDDGVLVSPEDDLPLE